MINGILVMIDSCILIKIVVVRVTHGVIKIEQIVSMIVFKVLMLALSIDVMILVSCPHRLFLLARTLILLLFLLHWLLFFFLILACLLLLFLLRRLFFSR